MRLISKLSLRRSGSRSGRAYRKAVQQAIESLECRRLMAATGETVSTIPAILATPSNSAGNAITLNQYFTDANEPGTLVTFRTTYGTIEVSLTDAATPLTVANFLSYVNSGAYNNTIFHRSAILSGSGTPSNTTPADIVQGGGDVVSGNKIVHIPTNAPVDDEYTSELYGDVPGTLAMAKTSDANSATSEWYFNENDNSQALDTPTTDSNGVTTSYTVFGKVISGLGVIKKISELPVYNVSSSLTTVPVKGMTQKQATARTTLTPNDLVYVRSVTSKSVVSYTVSSDDPALVTPTLSDGVLSFKYASGQFGTANITVKATNLDGTSASTTFPVTVPDVAQPTQGPVAAAVTSSPLVSGVQGTVNVLGSATDSVSPLTAAGVSIVTQPTNGTATVDTSTGAIDYTSNAGFTGNDTLTYTVTDAAGTVSAAATVTLDVIAAPITVTVGTKTSKSLTFTQPDGAVGQLSVTGGTALVTFSNDQVTTSTSDGIVTASGTGTTISNVTITNTRGQIASLKLTSSSAVTLGSVNDIGLVASITAPNASLSGASNLGSLNYLDIASATGLSLVIGKHFANPTLLIGSATNSSVTASTVGLIKSKQWLNTDAGSYFINASSIRQLDVSGTFADMLQLAGTGQDLAAANVTAASAAWQLAGSVLSANLSNPVSTFSLTAGGTIQNLNVTGTLSSTIEAPVINSLKVNGTASSAIIETTASTSTASAVTQRIGTVKVTGLVTGTTILSGDLLGSVTAGTLTDSNIYAGAIFSSDNSTVVASGSTFSSSVQQLGRVAVTGAASGDLIYSAGNIGTISTASLIGSRAYAGVTLTVAQSNSGLVDTTDDLTSNAKISSVTVGNGTSTFSNSQIDADKLGVLHLGDIATSNNGVALGVAADKITSIVATLDATTKLNLAPAQLTATKDLSATQVLNAYLLKKKIITTGTTTNTVNDFAIDLY
jgi:cyclophilin family peptidyl-prolyl cis-trans isomerase